MKVGIKGGGAGHRQASGLSNWKGKMCFSMKACPPTEAVCTDRKSAHGAGV